MLTLSPPATGLAGFGDKEKTHVSRRKGRELAHTPHCTFAECREKG